MYTQTIALKSRHEREGLTVWIFILCRGNLVGEN